MNIIKIFYSINQQSEKIKIFPEFFVNKNKNKCQIIYNNKIYPLKAELDKSDKNIKKIEIKLMLFSKISSIFDLIFSSELIVIYNIDNSTLKLNLINSEEKEFKNININKIILPSSFYEVKKITYKIEKSEPRLLEFHNKEPYKLRILGEHYVNRNKDKSFIIYNNKILHLEEFLEFQGVTENTNIEFFIYLISFEKIKDKSYMFYECSSLLEVKFNCQAKKNNKRVFNDTLIFKNNSTSIMENKINDEFSNIYYNNKNYKENSTLKSNLEKLELNLSNINSNNNASNDELLNRSDNDFYNCTIFEGLSPIPSLKDKTKNEKFNSFYSYSSIHFTNNKIEIDTINVTNISNMFNGCSSLIS